MITFLPDSFPLQWPEGWQKTPTKKRRKSRYKVKASKALENLKEAVRKLGGQGIIVSSNLPVGTRGGVAVSFSRPMKDPGVAIYWVKDGEHQCMACDQWETPHENMQAIFHAVEGYRTIERSGATQVTARMYQAMRLTAGPSQRGWRYVFGIEDDFTPSPALLKRLARGLSARYHPDNKDTGDETKFKEVQIALQEALEEIENG